MAGGICTRTVDAFDPDGIERANWYIQRAEERRQARLARRRELYRLRRDQERAGPAPEPDVEDDGQLTLFG